MNGFHLSRGKPRDQQDISSVQTTAFPWLIHVEWEGIGDQNKRVTRATWKDVQILRKVIETACVKLSLYNCNHTVSMSLYFDSSASISLLLGIADWQDDRKVKKSRNTEDTKTLDNEHPRKRLDFTGNGIYLLLQLRSTSTGYIQVFEWRTSIHT